MKGQQSLSDFYESVKFQNPGVAADMHEDVILVGLCGLVEDKSQAHDAVERLRHKTLDLPVIHAQVLENALADLGYDHV